MMADPVAVTRFALSTAAAGNTQDITISGFGTPKAAIFIWSLASTDDTIASAGRFGIGFTDGTNENAVDIDVANGGSTSSTERGHRTDCVINLTNSAASVVRFSFNSWITDGVRLDIDDATGTGYLVTCILFNSSEVSNAHVGFKDDLGTATSAIDINTVGFEPDLVFMTNIGFSTAPPAHGVEGLISFGVGHNDGFDTQRVAMVSSKDSVGTADSTAYIGNNSITGQAFSGVLNWDAVIGSYDSSGFSITPNASAGSDVVFYLCLKFTNSPNIKLFDMEWPASGSYAETGPGFEPTFGLIASVQGPASRNAVDNAAVYGISVAAFDGTSVYTNTATDLDFAGVMVAKNLSSDQLRILDYQGVNDAVLASSYAFDSQGWDFTLSTNPASAVLGWGLAIGAGATGGVTASPFGHQRLDNQYSAIAASRLNGVLQ